MGGKRVGDARWIRRARVSEFNWSKKETHEHHLSVGATLHNSYLLKLNNTIINIHVFLITDFACTISNFLIKCIVPRLLVFSLFCCVCSRIKSEFSKLSSQAYLDHSIGYSFVVLLLLISKCHIIFELNFLLKI